MKPEDVRRILFPIEHPLVAEVRQAPRLVGQLCWLGVAAIAIAAIVQMAAETRDDVRATRRTVERCQNGAKR